MDAEALYQEEILTLARGAREHPRLKNTALTATLRNPVCGDEVVVDIALDKTGKITAVGTEVTGCVLCEAATGLMLETLGLSVDDMQTLDANINAWLKGTVDAPPPLASLNGLGVLTPVKAFSSRHNCVRLPFQAAAKACNHTAQT